MSYKDVSNSYKQFIDELETFFDSIGVEVYFSMGDTVAESTPCAILGFMGYEPERNYMYDAMGKGTVGKGVYYDVAIGLKTKDGQVWENPDTEDKSGMEALIEIAELLRSELMRIRRERTYLETLMAPIETGIMFDDESQTFELEILATIGIFRKDTWTT